MSTPKLFYVPPGRPVRPVTGRKVILDDGSEVHNPKVDRGKHILPLANEVPPPDSRLYNAVPTYTVSPNKQFVQMAWTTSRKPVGELFARRIEELRALSQEHATALPGGFGPAGLTALLVHSITDALGGPGGYRIPKEDGTWVTLNRIQLRNATANLSARINQAGTNAETHLAALISLRDAADHEGLVAYDLTTGWPA